MTTTIGKFCLLISKHHEHYMNQIITFWYLSLEKPDIDENVKVHHI